MAVMTSSQSSSHHMITIYVLGNQVACMTVAALAFATFPAIFPLAKYVGKTAGKVASHSCKPFLLLPLFFHLRSPATECEIGVHSTLSPTLCSACLWGTVVATCASSQTTSSHPYPGHICTVGKYAVGNWTSSHTGSSYPQLGHIHAMLQQPPSHQSTSLLASLPRASSSLCLLEVDRTLLDVLA